MNREFACPEPVQADLKVANGTLDVDAGDYPAITVTVEPLDGSSASRDAAEQTRVELDGRRLIVHTPYASGWTVFKWPKLRVQVRLPQESTLTVKAAAARVRCSGTFADVVAHVASGDLAVDRVTKDASLTSASGSIEVTSVGGELRMHSASGDVTARHVGKAADAATASGDIEIVQADRGVRAKSASGDVTIGVARQGDIKIHTASGDVSVGVAAGTGVWLDLSTASGRTSSDLAMGDATAPAAGAQLTIKARTASGDITLRRVTPA